MNRGNMYMICMSVAFTFPSCKHKDLCFNHSEHALRYATHVEADYDLRWEISYDGKTDWANDWPALSLHFDYDELRPSTPEGLRVSAYDETGKHVVLNMEPCGEEISLSPGRNSLLFYNNDTEYIVFNDMEKYATASATTRIRTRGSYTGNPLYTKSDEPTVAPPDVLFGYHIDSYFQEHATEAQQLGITMCPLVFTYVVRYRFKHGLDYVALARGAMSGMAASISLHNRRTSTSTATLLYDCTIEPWGIQAIVKSFGIPDFPHPNDSHSTNCYGLNLEVRLHNGKNLNFYFDVTGQMLRQPHGGIITVDHIEIKDEEGHDNGSGFQVNVEDWGEFEDIEIELNKQ